MQQVLGQNYVECDFFLTWENSLFPPEEQGHVEDLICKLDSHSQSHSVSFTRIIQSSCYDYKIVTANIRNTLKQHTGVSSFPSCPLCLCTIAFLSDNTYLIEYNTGLAEFHVGFVAMCHYKL